MNPEIAQPMLMPPAVMGLKDGLAKICAWHEGKQVADAWAIAHGYQLTHSICSSCASRAFPGLGLEEALCCSYVKQASDALLEGAKAMKLARARLHGVTVEELDRRDTAVDAQAKELAEARALGLTVSEYRDHVKAMEDMAWESARMESLAMLDHRTLIEIPEPPV